MIVYFFFWKNKNSIFYSFTEWDIVVSLTLQIWNLAIGFLRSKGSIYIMPSLGLRIFSYISVIYSINIYKWSPKKEKEKKNLK